MVDGDHSGGRYWFEIPHGEEVEGPLETNMQAQFYEAIPAPLGNRWLTFLILPLK